MHLVHFNTIDDQGNRLRDIYINPELVRYVTSMQPYGKNERSKITLAMDDSVLVGVTAEEARRKLEGGAAADTTEKPPLRVVETP
jgi:hypothetical protein